MPRVVRVISWLLAIFVASCAAPAADATGRPSSGSSSPFSPSSEPSVADSAGAEPTATPSGGPLPHSWAAYGSHATVLADGLRVRLWTPGLDSEVTEVLATGDDLFVVDGSITLDGYDWYEVEFETSSNEDFRDGFGFGWVAGQPAPDSEGDDWFIRIGAVTCPSEVDTATLARLTPWVHQNCGIQVDSVSGLIDMCYERPMTPFSYEPDWAAFSCFFLRDEANTWFLPLAFPPDGAVPDLQRGDLVTLTGGLGFDAARYGPCTVSAGPGFPPARLDVESLLFASRCETRFVVTGGTIDGHIELPPMY